MLSYNSWITCVVFECLVRVRSNSSSSSRRQRHRDLNHWTYYGTAWSFLFNVWMVLSYVFVEYSCLIANIGYRSAPSTARQLPPVPAVPQLANTNSPSSSGQPRRQLDRVLQ
ncbi:unnamed protein product [Fusarium graminearum]|nr:unnamed protein product [Fusarium graminearum]CAG2002739.1 unnamed protein product [Fusarium graminearum]VTO92124.1 unnamed protein product [Fusarium graminearum]